MIVGHILAVVVLVLSWAAPVLVPVLLFALLAFILFVAIGDLLDMNGDFDVEAAIACAAKSMDDEQLRIKPGVDGEEAALNTVSVLDDDCTIFANLDIKYDGGHNETDMIVLTPAGLTVIEVKNYSGCILGDLSDPELVKRRYTSQTLYTDKPESNPVKQMDAPIGRLNHYLCDRGITVNIRRCALFVNSNVQLQVTDHFGVSRNCALYLLDSPGFLPYLHGNGTQLLSPALREKIVDALKKQM